jgi:hypothetical protein
MTWLIGGAVAALGLVLILYGITLDEQTVARDKRRYGGWGWLADWGLGRLMLELPLWLQRPLAIALGLAIFGLGIAALVTES